MKVSLSLQNYVGFKAGSLFSLFSQLAFLKEERAGVVAQLSMIDGS